ncbi:ABC-2 type transport system ATP-binding protein [Paraoerskovia marina]|uniref:ABC-2 type transport system ATP-binding protein n=1 Tax=Paraoerskovia marina TaxID=545619 RepID=A0A1H1RCX6_9CELL|nr:ABC-2 type transport system ATP-binding protein [Paraoerskovia marina]
MANDLAIETRGLRKTYRSRRGASVGVRSLDLEVPVGGVHGFLGPNGSGKTTTIRMLLGLVRADEGEMRIFGHEVPDRLPAVVRRIGAIVEHPKFYPAFTGRKNLQILATGIGVPVRRVDEVLDSVGLGDRGKDAFRKYSLGMKQRLAIAATLLKDPDLLIFDEPTNGLDPAGIREIRETMRALAVEGKTVLVSSHILAEVEQVADTVSIVSEGTIVSQGRVADLLSSRTAATARVLVADPARALNILQDAGFVVRGDGEALIVEGVENPADVTRTLALQGSYVSALVPHKADLESVFLELTGTAERQSGEPTEGVAR